MTGSLFVGRFYTKAQRLSMLPPGYGSVMRSPSDCSRIDHEVGSIMEILIVQDAYSGGVSP